MQYGLMDNDGEWKSLKRDTERIVVDFYSMFFRFSGPPYKVFNEVLYY